ncbi:MAG TPA: type II toxin-antitoxin system RelE/ParE family toxin [bacterium]|nr:type II toxin-antitoxin system RelE/ParE family toxin [bacterium]
MAKIIWTEPALEDVNRIADYSALVNLQAADTLVTKIFQRVDKPIHYRGCLLSVYCLLPTAN